MWIELNAPVTCQTPLTQFVVSVRGEGDSEDKGVRPLLETNGEAMGGPLAPDLRKLMIDSLRSIERCPPGCFLAARRHQECRLGALSAHREKSPGL